MNTYGTVCAFALLLSALAGDAGAQVDSTMPPAVNCIRHYIDHGTATIPESLHINKAELYRPRPPQPAQYPTRAYDSSVSGLVILEVKVLSAEKLSVTLRYEDPVGYGFGNAAMAAVEDVGFPTATEGYVFQIPFMFHSQDTCNQMSLTKEPFFIDSLQRPLANSLQRPGIDSLESPAEMIKQGFPRYPISALRSQSTGIVWIKTFLDSTGEALQNDILKTSGNFALDQAALDASWNCTFKPAMQHGHGVQIWVSYKVAFLIEK